MSGSNDWTGEMSPALEDTLRAGLRADVLTDDALRRIRGAAEAEWRRNLVPAHRGRLAVAAAIVGIAVACTAALLVIAARDTEGVLMAHLERADAPGTMLLRDWRSDLPVRAGAGLHVGQSFEARGNSLVVLVDGGNLRLARASVFEIEGANQVRLESGEMYVDIPPGTHAGHVFVARTTAGEFHHVGTQFALAVIDGTTRLRVREGVVRWHTPDGDSTVAAGTELMIDGDRKVSTRSIVPTGREFAWTEAVTPDVDIENRPLTEFLNWVARETGRKLEFADEEVRRRAAAIRMHGEVRGLTTMQALSAVTAATALRFELPDGVIRVSFAGAPPPPPK